MIPTNPNLGEGVMDPNEPVISGDELLEEIARLTAGLIFNGPSLDDVDFLLDGEGE